MSQLTLQIPTTDTDRGQCQDLDTETMKRCEGRMIVTYKKESHTAGGMRYSVSCPVWTCDKCGKVAVP